MQICNPEGPRGSENGQHEGQHGLDHGFLFMIADQVFRRRGKKGASVPPAAAFLDGRRGRGGRRGWGELHGESVVPFDLSGPVGLGHV